MAFDSGPVAQVAVTADGTVAAANDRARALFGLNHRDIGRPLQDLEMSYRPVELRSMIDRAQIDRRVITAKEVEWPTHGGADRMYFDVQVLPVLEPAGPVLGVTVTFTDVTRHRQLQDDLQRSHQELEAAYEELQSTSEELETTNEELQSTVEELETTNEELQSTNEELETMNEELQSTNEELTTINDELRQRSDELNEVNAFLNAILTSLRTGVVVLDRELRVQAWNRKVEDMWGLRSDEVQGKFFGSLDIGLPVHELTRSLRSCLGGEDVRGQPILEATNRRGKPIQVRVSCGPLRGAADDTRGVIVLMEETLDGQAGA